MTNDAVSEGKVKTSQNAMQSNAVFSSFGKKDKNAVQLYLTKLCTVLLLALFFTNENVKMWLQVILNRN